MSHGLTVMAPSGFLSRLTKCAESQDLRLESLDVRKATLAKVLARAAPGLRLNEHMEEEDGPLVFHHACKLSPEGIVSKRKDSLSDDADYAGHTEVEFKTMSLIRPRIVQDRTLRTRLRAHASRAGFSAPLYSCS